MSRCFITQQIPQHLVVKYNTSQAGVTFCNNLVKFKLFDEAIAIPTLNVSEDISEELKKDLNYNYIQFRRFRHKKIGKLLNALVENWLVVLMALKYDKIWFYNLNKQTILSFILLRYFFRKKVFILLADFRPGKKLSINSLIKKMIESSYGLVTLSKRTNFKNNNIVCLPGIVPSDKVEREIISYKSRSFLLSGVLKQATGIDMAIEVFSRLPHCTLYISGLVEDDYVAKLNSYSNIHYLGYLEYNEYNDLLREIAVGLSFRDPDAEINLNNFPSKILEYFSKNKLVLSTIEYPEIEGLGYIYTDYSLDSIIEKINKINEMTENEFNILANNGDKLVDIFGKSAWEKALNKVDS